MSMLELVNSKATNDQSSQDSAVTKQYEEANKQLAKLKETGQKLNTQKNEAESQLTSLRIGKQVLNPTS